LCPSPLSPHSQQQRILISLDSLVIDAAIKADADTLVTKLTLAPGSLFPGQTPQRDAAHSSSPTPSYSPKSLHRCPNSPSRRQNARRSPNHASSASSCSEAVGSANLHSRSNLFSLCLSKSTTQPLRTRTKRRRRWMAKCVCWKFWTLLELVHICMSWFVWKPNSPGNPLHHSRGPRARSQGGG